AGVSIKVDVDGNIFVGGFTSSNDFPVTPGAFQPTGADDVFILKIKSDFTSLIYSTYLGGSDEETAFDIAIDSDGNAYIVGTTQSDDFPTVNPLQAQRGGEKDGFIAKLNPTGSALLFSTYLGGTENDQVTCVAVDAGGNVFVGGLTNSIDFPTADP